MYNFHLGNQPASAQLVTSDFLPSKSFHQRGSVQDFIPSSNTNCQMETVLLTSSYWIMK